MQVLYAVENMKGELKMVPGETCILLGKDEIHLAEQVVYGLMSACHDGETKCRLHNILHHLRVSHTPQEVQ